MKTEREIKFTTDGKKVVVIGSLNSQEKIVQEIFIVDGSEIPSGEHFVVKSLHDAPAVSWKESELVKLNARYEKERSSVEHEIDVLRKTYRAKSAELRERISYIGSALKNANEDSFNTLVDFICGDIKFIVINQHDLEILPIEEFHQMYEDRLRLISLFGKDDGTFTYAIGAYYDFSGGNKHFIPFKNYEDAFEKFKELLLSSGANDNTIKIAKKHGIEFPKEVMDQYKENKISNYSKNIDTYKKNIASWEEEIEKTKTL